MKHKKKQKHLEDKYSIKTSRMSRGPCNTQEDTPQRQSPAEAAAPSQAAGESPDFSQFVILAFPPLNRPGLDKEGPCNTQEDTPQRQSPAEAAAPSQAAGESPDFSQCPILVFPSLKRRGLDKEAKLDSPEDALQHRHKAVAITQPEKESKATSSDSVISISSKDTGNGAEHCISQDNVPQPDSTVKVPACSWATAAEESGSSEHLIGDSITIKCPRIDEDEHCISQNNVPQPDSTVEVPACSWATAAEESGSSEHLIGAFTIMKRLLLGEDVSQQSDGKVSGTGDFEKPASQSVRKQKSTKGHLRAKLDSPEDALQHRHKTVAITQPEKESKASSSDSVISISSKDTGNGAEHRISQDKGPQPESLVEAPACNQDAGAKSDFSEHLVGVSTTSKRPRLDEDGKEYTVSQQPDGKVSGTGAFEKPANQSVRKRKSTKGHLRAKLDSPEDALQHRHKAVAITQPKKESKVSSSDSVISISSKDTGNGAEHRISQDKGPQPESLVEAPACNQDAGAKSDFSEHLVGVSTTSKRPRLDEDGKEYTVSQQPDGKVSGTGAFEKPANQSVRKRKSTKGHLRAKLDSPEDALQHRLKAVAIIQPEKESKASSSDSVISISSKDTGNGAEHRISQDKVPQPESPVKAPACSHPAGEKSDISEHLVGVSTTSKRPRLDEDDKEYTEIKEMPVSQFSEQTKDSSDYSHSKIPSRALTNTEPVMSPVPGTEQRLKKIYYMHVQLKRGLVVSYHTKEGWVPPSKKIKMEEMLYIGKVHKNVPASHMSEDKHLIAPEPMLDSRAQEKRGEADSPAQPPAQSWYPTAKTPEWLVAQDSGVRCMACCRVFPSLEVLQEHVEFGVREGFSCHVYHDAMTTLKSEERQRKKRRE